MKTSIAKGFAYLTSASFVSTLLQIIKGKLMAVFLGAAAVGIYSQLMNLFSLLFTLVSLGFRNGIIKEISSSVEAGDEVAIRQHYSSVLIFISLFSIIAISILGIFSSSVSHLLFADNGEKSHWVMLVMMAVPFATLANLYHALLSGYMAVKAIVKAQIFADILSLIPFCLLIYYQDLSGAVLAVIAYQALKLICNAIYFYRSCPDKQGWPKLKDFKWLYVGVNIRFGASGLLLVSLNLLVVIFISRLVIEDFGEQENGFFSAAFKISTVYLGAIYANASSYYFPLLAKSNNAEKLTYDVNHTCRFYLYFLPALIIIIMSGGELLIELLFSKEFLPAVTLLLLFLPGDLLRICSETFGLPLLAREKFLAYNSTYLLWAIFYVSLVLMLIDQYGIIAIGIAYLVSHFVNFIFVVILARVVLNVKLTKSFMVCFGLALIFVGLSSTSNFLLQDFWLGVALNAGIVIFWFALSCLQPEFRGYLVPLWNKFKYLVYEK